MIGAFSHSSNLDLEVLLESADSLNQLLLGLDARLLLLLKALHDAAELLDRLGPGRLVRLLRPGDLLDALDQLLEALLELRHLHGDRFLLLHCRLDFRLDLLELPAHRIAHLLRLASLRRLASLLLGLELL